MLCNFTPEPRFEYRCGVPQLGDYRERFNSDAECYGGSNCGNQGAVSAEEVPAQGRPYSIAVTLPPLATVVFQLEEG